MLSESYLIKWLAQWSDSVEIQTVFATEKCTTFSFHISCISMITKEILASKNTPNIDV